MSTETQKLNSETYEIRMDGTKLILSKDYVELFNTLKELIDQKEEKVPNGYILRMFEFYQRNGHLKKSDYLRKDYLVSMPFFTKGINCTVSDPDEISTKFTLEYLIQQMNSCLFPAYLHALASYYMFEFIPYREEWNGLSSEEITNILHELKIEDRDDLVRFYTVNPYYLNEYVGYWYKHINIKFDTINFANGFIPCIIKPKSQGLKLFKPKTVGVSKKFAFRAALYRRVALKMLNYEYSKDHEQFSQEKLVELYQLESLGKGRRLSEMKQDNGYAYGKWLRDIDVKTMLDDICRGDFHPYEYLHNPVDRIHNKGIILNYLDRTKIQDTTFLKEMLLSDTIKEVMMDKPTKGRGIPEGIVILDDLPYLNED